MARRCSRAAGSVWKDGGADTTARKERALRSGPPASAGRLPPRPSSPGTGSLPVTRCLGLACQTGAELLDAGWRVEKAGGAGGAFTTPWGARRSQGWSKDSGAEMEGETIKAGYPPPPEVPSLGPRPLLTEGP